MMAQYIFPRCLGFTFAFRFVFILTSMGLPLIAVQGQSILDLPCNERETAVSIPTADPSFLCLERVVTSTNANEMTFTGLAAFSDGRLFTVSPFGGTLIEFIDTNDDALPDTPEVRAEGLNRPVGVTAYQDELYMTGGSAVYRWRDESGLETLVSGLPVGSGYWNGGIAVGVNSDSARLYVGIGAECDFCAEAVEDAERGVILSFALDGTDRQLIATGFRQPSGLTWYQDSLWVTDTAPAHFDTGRHDELNRILLNDTVADYGAPFCGGQNEPLRADATCENTVEPIVTFSSGSVPVVLTTYQREAFPSFVDQFVFGFSGSAHASRMQGYTVELFAITEERTSQLTLVPAVPDRDQQYGGVGFYPHHVYGLAISPEGWIYLSVGGGSIYVLRPAAPKSQ
jgi:glucose/arabinose dehydrogenase